jgi:hypothetical protein
MVSPYMGKWPYPAWLVAAALTPAAPALEPVAPRIIEPVSTDSPEGWLRHFESAYEGRNAVEYGTLFSDDFRFFFGTSDLAARYPDGWTRDDEIASAEHLFHGFTNATGRTLPAARQIEVGLDPHQVQPDPEKPDSAAWYRVVVVPSVSVRFWFEGSTTADVEWDRHEFWLVRGDAARVAGADRPADADHWYVRRWVEKVAGGGYAVSLPLRSGSPDADPDRPSGRLP